MSDIEVASAAFILMGWCYLQKKKNHKRWWQANLYRDRSVNGASNLLIILKNQEISGQYKHFIRMSSTDFEYLRNVIWRRVAKEYTTFRRAISVTERLAVTLRFYASGDPFTIMFFKFIIMLRISGIPQNRFIPIIFYQ
jgi:hypothetical protein